MPNNQYDMHTTKRHAQQHKPLEIDLLLETGGGGSGRHVLDLYRGLESNGLDVKLIVSLRRADAAFLANLAEIQSDKIKYLDLHRPPHLSDIPAELELRRFFRTSGRYHLLHAHSTKAGIIGWRLGNAPVAKVFTPHAYRGMDTSLRRMPGFAIRSAEKIFSRGYDKIVAVSLAEATYLKTLGVPDNKVATIPNGVDIETIQKIAANAKPRDSSEKIIGFVGRLVHQKNPQLFLRALQLLLQRGENVKAMIVGDGPLWDELQDEAIDLGIEDRVIWKGAVPALSELGNMDVAIHTSRYESLPYTLLELAAAGVPLVAVENAGSNEVMGAYLRDCIVSDGDPVKIATCVQALLHDGPARRQHLNTLRMIVETFSLNNMIEATMRVYEEVLNNLQLRPAFAEVLHADVSPQTAWIARRSV
jgi:glycosyltransferase involved in cell wall biosynthesis